MKELLLKNSKADIELALYLDLRMVLNMALLFDAPMLALAPETFFQL